MAGSYKDFSDSEWDCRIKEAFRSASSCRLCPRECGVNRVKGQKGVCGAGNGLKISSVFPHFGEEPPISGKAGSGTVFFSHCTLSCVFCQNYVISNRGKGRNISTGKLAEKMLNMQKAGCHNINLVTPAHFIPWILKAVRFASREGLVIPLIYNSGGYENTEVLKLLEGIIDIYLPDMKYWSSNNSKIYSGVSDYPKKNRETVIEMYRQTGPLKLDTDSNAVRGLLIRHLVLPSDISGSYEIINWISEAFPGDMPPVSIMGQYRPLFRAGRYIELSRKVTSEYYNGLLAVASDRKVDGFSQELENMDDEFIIDFDKESGSLDAE